MPEAPEAHTIAKILNKNLIGKQIISVSFTPHAKHVNLDRLTLPATIINVLAYGKKPIIFLDTNESIIVSLGMEGKLTFIPGNHSNIYFTISEIDQNLNILSRLYFDDSRHFGNITVTINPLEYNQYFQSIGPDILRSELSPTQWIKLFREKGGKRQICVHLLDQSIVSGIGNYLKAEILYNSRIRPDRRIHEISNDELEDIRKSTYTISRLSLQYNGLTIKSYYGPEGEKGAYPCQVYNRRFDPEGRTVITSKFADGRTTHWVPNYQI